MPEHSQKQSTHGKSRNAHLEPPSPPEPQEKSRIESPAQAPANDIKQYIEAATDAAERSRRVLIVLITASVLTLVATWNSREDGWFDESYNLVKAASILITENNKPISLNDPEIIALSEGDKTNLYERAEQYLKQSHITKREDVQKILDSLASQRAEHLAMVRMPFFGVGFHINDIGIFAGLTFAVVLLWFRFSLVREVNNLRRAFHKAGKQDEAQAEANGRDGSGEHQQLQFCYDMLAMRQVLTTPKMLPLVEKNTSLGRLRRSWHRLSWHRQMFWFLIAKSLFLLPVLVHIIVMINDHASMELGRIVSPSNTDIVLTASWILLVSILILTALCYVLVFNAHTTWKEAAKVLGLE
jgi:hypothetical protein